MTKKQQNKLVPRLRFPEFKDSGEWETKVLGNVFCERVETGFTSLPLLSLTEKEGIVLQETTGRRDNSSTDKSKYLRICPGDVAYNTMRMWEGRSAYVAMEGLVSPAYTICSPLKGNNGLFFSHYFKTTHLIKEFHRFSQGLVKDTLNLKYDAFSKITIVIPRSKEQQKIADCLSSLDELITA
ncbi:MAG: restriction endonuclease subunit S, partial [Bacteroidetes bacterium]|nr:restriction endonuclease subunit S [Bacteroidota bacterium]